MVLHCIIKRGEEVGPMLTIPISGTAVATEKKISKRKPNIYDAAKPSEVDSASYRG